MKKLLLITALYVALGGVATAKECPVHGLLSTVANARELTTSVALMQADIEDFVFAKDDFVAYSGLSGHRIQC